MGSTAQMSFKVAPYSFSAREEWELNWHKRAREERDSPSQMTCANQPPRRTFPKSDWGIFMAYLFKTYRAHSSEIMKSL